MSQNNPVEYDLTETFQFVELCAQLGVRILNLSAGSPYYNPHIQRPAAYPPSDGYQPPEDPLVGVARQINVVRQVAERLRGLAMRRPTPNPSQEGNALRLAPDPSREGIANVPSVGGARGGLVLVGSAYSYLQEYLPHVAQYVVRNGWTDMIGLGRMTLAYPNILADAVEKGAIEKKFICRTFSDCTTAPRNGLISGCYPLDKFYATKPESQKLREIKKTMGA